MWFYRSSGLCRSQQTNAWFWWYDEFTLKDDSIENAKRVLSSTKVFALAESLGGVESLINHPASMTHASIPREERIKNGLTDSLIRLSVGIEDIDDLVNDINEAIG